MLNKLKTLFTATTETVNSASEKLPPKPLPNISYRLEELTQLLNKELQKFYKEKGNNFEAYVVRKFDPKYFRLIYWRSDKQTGDIYAKSNTYPDLVFEFQHAGQTHYLAVECKWRSEWYKGGVNWAKDYQIRNYQLYQREKKMPVFVVIGVTGSPTQPKNLYVIPLNRLKYPFATDRYLAQFKRTTPQRNFFFDARHGSLR